MSLCQSEERTGNYALLKGKIEYALLIENKGLSNKHSPYRASDGLTLTQ